MRILFFQQPALLTRFTLLVDIPPDGVIELVGDSVVMLGEYADVLREVQASLQGDRSALMGGATRDVLIGETIIKGLIWQPQGSGQKSPRGHKLLSRLRFSRGGYSQHRMGHAGYLWTGYQQHRMGRGHE